MAKYTMERYVATYHTCVFDMGYAGACECNHTSLSSKPVYTRLSFFCWRKWNISSLQWIAISKLTRHSCLLTHSANIYQIWFPVTVAYRRIQVATVTMHCIQLRRGMQLLARGKWADFNLSYITDEM